MATFGAFFDANVLYPSGLRNFLMHLAVTGIFRAHWSAQVHEEWIGNLLKNRPDLTRAKLERTRHLMDNALPDALVTGYEQLIDSIELPDRNDRHVLAAAIRCGASVIVTVNLRDFPNRLSPNSASKRNIPTILFWRLWRLSQNLWSRLRGTIAPVSRILQRRRTNTLPSSTRRAWKNPPSHFVNSSPSGLPSFNATQQVFSWNTSCRLGGWQSERTPEIGQVIQHGMECGPHLVLEVILNMRNRATKVSADNKSGVFQLSKVLRQHLLRRRR